MSEREKDFKENFGQQKARVKLYKSKKSWVKASINEIELLKTIGLPFLSKNIEKETIIEGRKGNKLTKNAAKTIALVGGAFTFNMLHNHQALASSEPPITSEVSSNSETVANQNSTTIKNSQTKTSISISTDSNQLSSENKKFD
ncbi:KxYKxGKxW signal peptide domain-containing protein [Staphylococcus saccharolyticus]